MTPSSQGSPEKRNPFVDRAQACTKTIEIRGRKGTRLEVNGKYDPVKEHSGGFPAWRNKRSQVYLVREPLRPRWKVVSRLTAGAEVLALADAAEDNEAALPFE